MGLINTLRMVFESVEKQTYRFLSKAVVRWLEDQAIRSKVEVGDSCGLLGKNQGDGHIDVKDAPGSKPLAEAELSGLSD